MLRKSAKVLYNLGISMKRRQHNSANQGFTIVELLVAIVVGAIFATAINSVFTTHVYVSQRGRDLILANAYVEGKIEALRSKGFLGLSDGTTDIASELPAELKAPRSGTLVISSYNTAVKKVIATVTYNEQGKSRTYSYTTYVGELGAGQY